MRFYVLQAEASASAIACVACVTLRCSCRMLRETASAIKTKQVFADSIDLFPLKKISAALCVLTCVRTRTAMRHTSRAARAEVLT